MNKKIRIVIAGPRGKMGSEAVNMVNSVSNFELVGLIDKKHGVNGNVPIFTDIVDCIKETKPDVLVDLTVPEAAFYHGKSALQAGIKVVMGTTGLTSEELNELKRLSIENKTGCIIAPNFAIGAVLMMKFSQMAAKYYQDVEILEMHHDQKLDAPSGTAIKTAEMIKLERMAKKQGHPNEKENLKGSRGADFDGMRIHSVRLPGLVAHQQVMFGSTGETLTIRHDSYNRTSFMTGVKLSVETVMNLDDYVYGLENIID